MQEGKRVSAGERERESEKERERKSIEKKMFAEKSQEGFSVAFLMP